MARPVSNVDVRSLRRLHSGASTSRVLNLLRLSEEAIEADAPLDPPLFATAALNRAFFVKHRLRADEGLQLSEGRSTVTKILIPIDPKDLRSGGRYLFIGQDEWLETLTDAVGTRLADRPEDLKVLKVLDTLPSFDPFILREKLHRVGSFPDARLFQLSTEAVNGMEAFVIDEIANLIQLSLGGGSGSAQMVRKLLANDDGDELEPLRRTLRMGGDEFAEGMFCWRGFLYYKWVCVGMEAQILCTMRDMQGMMPRSRGPAGDANASLEQARRRVGRNLVTLFSRAAEFIAGYDEAYAVLIKAENPMAFRHFLLNSPVLFLQLGELIGTIEHVLQFWNYRCENQLASRMPMKELSDLIYDFDMDLAAIAA